MLDDPALVVEAEDVDTGVLLVRPDLVAVEDDVPALAMSRLNSTRFPGNSVAMRSK
ncbi:hypothetical protein [Streptomyces sp. NPDC048639]|uniref:hypothetical protein n=1 Tax=Streptomyces sp. NPDC048639 TaxID=3365581 RepID=UPI00371C013D